MAGRKAIIFASENLATSSFEPTFNRFFRRRTMLDSRHFMHFEVSRQLASENTFTDAPVEARELLEKLPAVHIATHANHPPYWAVVGFTRKLSI